MARREKTFDCVEMKRQIQARLLEETERLGEEEVFRRHRQWLETSDDPLARWWRLLGSKAEPKAAASQQSTAP